MCSDRRHPLFRNLDSTVTVDVVRGKSYVNSLLGAINSSGNRETNDK